MAHVDRTDSVAENPATPARGIMLAMLLIVFAINLMDRQILAILIEPIKRDLGLSDSAVGMLYGFTFAAFYTVLGIPIARLADRANRVRIITSSLVLFSVMTALCGMASNYWQLLVARVGVGIGEAGTNPPSHSIIADLYPLERRSSAMAVFGLGAHIGILLGFLIGGWLGQLFGWRSAFQVAGVGGIAFAYVLHRLLREPPRIAASGVVTPVERTVQMNAAVHTILRSASMRHLFAAGAVISIASYAVIGWLPAFLMRSHAMSLSATGVVLALMLGVVGGLGTLCGGLLADHVGKRDAAWRLRMVAIGFLIAGPCWAIVLVEESTVIALVLLALPAAFLGFHIGPTFAMVQSLVEPSMRALAASLLLFAANLIGMGFGPLVVGMLSDSLLRAYGPDSLRAALLIVPPLFLWSAYHYYAAGRTIATDLRTAAIGHAHACRSGSSTEPTG